MSGRSSLRVEEVVPGDRVRFVSGSTTNLGRLFEVVGASGSYIKARYLEGPREGEVSSWFVWRFEKVIDNLDLTKGVKTRDGYSIIYLGRSDDPERPILAALKLDGEERILTYQPSGLFYKNLQSPIDLVNHG